MRQIEKIGKTVDEAIELALQELNTTKDKVNIEILDEGNKGIFGIFGGKEAKVRVIVINNVVEKALEFLNHIFDTLKMKVDMEYIENNNSLEIILKGSEMGVLIGHRGENLDALQYLTSIVANKGEKEYTRINIDSENYRQKREETLKQLANRIAAKVARDRKNITLEPMNPYERRIIHAALQNNKYVETSSIGNEPNRRVIISYKK